MLIRTTPEPGRPAREPETVPLLSVAVSVSLSSCQWRPNNVRSRSASPAMRAHSEFCPHTCESSLISGFQTI